MHRQGAGTVPKTNGSREIIKRLRAEGWRRVRTRGSHYQFRHPVKSGVVTVVHRARSIPTGTLHSIFRQAGWEWPPKD
jgi:predicted RNA binding protein YcfA (HicA-like mRNA interferase family)